MKTGFSSLIVLLHLLPSVTPYPHVRNPESYLRSRVQINYRTDVMPLNDNSSAIDVQLSYALVNIENVDEVNAILTVRGWIRTVWTDNFLHWDPEEHSGVDSLHMDMGQLWNPDIRLYNSLEERVDWAKGTLDSSGQVVHDAPATYRVQCAEEGNSSYYCPLQFGSWIYAAQESIRLHPDDTFGAINLSNFIESPAWDVVSTNSSIQSWRYDCCDEVYENLVLDINLEKKTRS